MAEVQGVAKAGVPVSKVGEVTEADVGVAQNRGLVLAEIVSAQSAGTKSHILLVSAVSIRPAQNVEQEWFASRLNENYPYSGIS
jgi:hypothetical protein